MCELISAPVEEPVGFLAGVWPCPGRVQAAGSGCWDGVEASDDGSEIVEDRVSVRLARGRRAAGELVSAGSVYHHRLARRLVGRFAHSSCEHGGYGNACGSGLVHRPQFRSESGGVGSADPHIHRETVQVGAIDLVLVAYGQPLQARWSRAGRALNERNDVVFGSTECVVPGRHRRRVTHAYPFREDRPPIMHGLDAAPPRLRYLAAMPVAGMARCPLGAGAWVGLCRA